MNHIDYFTIATQTIYTQHKVTLNLLHLNCTQICWFYLWICWWDAIHGFYLMFNRIKYIKLTCKNAPVPEPLFLSIVDFLHHWNHPWHSDPWIDDLSCHLEYPEVLVGRLVGSAEHSDCTKISPWQPAWNQNFGMTITAEFILKLQAQCNTLYIIMYTCLLIYKYMYHSHRQPTFCKFKTIQLFQLSTPIGCRAGQIDFGPLTLGSSASLV